MKSFTFPKNQTWETTFRVSGSYRAPFNIVAASVFEYQSGAPLARTALFRGLSQLGTVTLRMEPIGSVRLPGVKLLNFWMGAVASGELQFDVR